MVKSMQIVRYATWYHAGSGVGVSIGLKSIGGGPQGAILLTEYVHCGFGFLYVSRNHDAHVDWRADHSARHGERNQSNHLRGYRLWNPSRYWRNLQVVNTGEFNFLVLLAIVVIIIATVLSIIFVELGERRVPVFMLAR